MNSFGDASKTRLATCDPRLIALFEDVVQRYDCQIIQGARSLTDEQANIAKGVSKLTDPLSSKHVVGPQRPLALAVDVAPYPVAWPDANTMTRVQYVHTIARFYHFAGYVKARAAALGIALRWGGDWDSDGDFSDQAFDDLDHFELIN